MVSQSAHALGRAVYLPQCRLDIWTVRDGLPSRDINAIAQTPDGFLWLGTSSGLIRFDGVTFTTFDKQNTPGLMSNDITALAVDSHGTLWVGTNWGGFGTFDGNRFMQILPDISHWNIVTAFYETLDGTMWASGGGNSVIYGVTGHQITSTFRTHDAVIALSELPRHGLLTCSVSLGLSTISRVGNEQKFVSGTPTTGFYCMTRTHDGAAWIGSQHEGLYRVLNGRLTKYTQANGLPSNVVRTLYEDREGVLWVGTNNGVARWDGQSFASFDKSEGLSDSQVTAIFEDREGSLWVGAGTGLNRFARSKLNPFTLVSGLAVSTVGERNGIAAASPGGIWCATDMGLWHVTPQSARLVQLPKGVAADYVQAVLEGPDNLVWLISRSKDDTATFTATPASVLNLVQATSTKSSFTVHDSVGFLAAAALRGRLVVLANSSNGMELLDIAAGRIVRRQSADFGYVFTMTPDARGVIWVGCARGLVTIRDGVSSSIAAGMPDGAHVLGIDASNADDVWIASDHGLGRVRNGKWKVYGVGAGLPDQNLNQVLRAGDIVWIGCNSGLFTISVRDIERYDSNQIARIPFTLYSASDGLRSFPNLFTAAKSRDGRLWFAGLKSVTMVDPEHLYTNTLPPPVVIEAATVNGTKLGNRSWSIPPGSGILDVHFAALSFQAPERVLFRYQLRGFDLEWSAPSGSRTVRYTNLPPGRYTFVVQAANNDGVWNNVGASVSFDLRPHYYQTGWFRTLCFVIVFAIFALAFYMRSRQIELRNRELELCVTERTLELKEANEALQSTHEELVAQNLELTEMQTTLADANARLEALATTDGLTGAKNHRAFRERLDHEWKRRFRSKEPLSLILLDVDKFKQYNDTYGHPGGDEVLKTVARLLSVHARECDFVARYGGEEFVVIAPSADLNGAVNLAERLRSAIESAEWPQRSVTASFGVATTTKVTESVSDLLAEADAALYRSKEGGRNRVTHASTMHQPVV